MELVSTEVQTLRSHVIPSLDEVLILPLGDIQFGVAACDVDRLKRYVDWAASQKNVYLVGMGDATDFGSPSNRARLKALIETGDLYDSAEDILHEGAQSKLEELEKILEPLKGKFLGMVAGHHAWDFPDNTTTDTRLCDFLEAPFLGDSAIINVRFQGNTAKPVSFNIFATHGTGGGQLQSAPLNKLERFANTWENIDIFLMGHQHKKVAAKLPRISPVFKGRQPKLSQRNVVLAGTGSFLKGYLEGSERAGLPAGGYVEKRMLTPLTLGAVVISVRPREDGTIDLDVSL